MHLITRGVRAVSHRLVSAIVSDHHHQGGVHWFLFPVSPIPPSVRPHDNPPTAMAGLNQRFREPMIPVVITWSHCSTKRMPASAAQQREAHVASSLSSARPTRGGCSCKSAAAAAGLQPGIAVHPSAASPAANGTSFEPTILAIIMLIICR